MFQTKPLSLSAPFIAKRAPSLAGGVFAKMVLVNQGVLIVGVAHEGIRYPSPALASATSLAGVQLNQVQDNACESGEHNGGDQDKGHFLHREDHP